LELNFTFNKCQNAPFRHVVGQYQIKNEQEDWA